LKTMSASANQRPVIRAPAANSLSPRRLLLPRGDLTLSLPEMEHLHWPTLPGRFQNSSWCSLAHLSFHSEPHTIRHQVPLYVWPDWGLFSRCDDLHHVSVGTAFSTISGLGNDRSRRGDVLSRFDGLAQARFHLSGGCCYSMIPSCGSAGRFGLQPLVSSLAICSCLLFLRPRPALACAAGEEGLADMYLVLTHRTDTLMDTSPSQTHTSFLF
jgi:hypothetical protein